MEAISIDVHAFKNGRTIPKKHTCDGEDVSPSVSWENPRDSTRSLVLIMDDPDAPVGTFTHWVLYNIPFDKEGLKEGVSKVEKLADGSLQGLNDFRRVGYNGPCPPPGSPHRYFFKIYALDVVLDLDAGATKSQVEKAMDGHILAKGEYMGLYGR